jgi:hypothetical protein
VLSELILIESSRIAALLQVQELFSGTCVDLKPDLLLLSQRLCLIWEQPSGLGKGKSCLINL